MVAAAERPRQWLDKGATPLSLIASMLSCMAELMKEAASIAEGDAKKEQSRRLDGERYDWWHHDSQYNRWSADKRNPETWTTSCRGGNRTGREEAWLGSDELRRD